MPLISSDDIRYKLEEINDVLGKKYRLGHPAKERDWRTYEQEFSHRIKTAMRDLEPLIGEAVSTIRTVHGPGHPHSLSLEQRVKLLLIKQLVGESNRMFANMLDVFSMVSGINCSRSLPYCNLRDPPGLYFFGNNDAGLYTGFRVDEKFLESGRQGHP